MSTRSTINVYGGAGGPDAASIRLYLRDGGPVEALGAVAQAAERARPAADARSMSIALVSNRGDRAELDRPTQLVLRPVEGPGSSFVEAIRELTAAAAGSPTARVEGDIVWIRLWEPACLGALRVAILASRDIDGRADPWRIPAGEDLDAFPLQQRLSVEGLGLRSDLEWSYFVDVDKRNVNVYGGSIGCSSELVAMGKADPRSCAASCLPEYVGEALAALDAATAKLANIGWTLNQAELGIEAQCQAEARRFKELAEVDALAGRRAAFPGQLGSTFFEGPIVHVGERYALQAARVGGKVAPVVHDLRDLDDVRGALAVGRRFRLAYGADGRASVERAVERKEQPGPSR